jgi:hypothetical protein
MTNAMVEMNASGTSGTAPALKINYLGVGNALVVEDSTSPDNTPFVIASDGNVGIGTFATDRGIITIKQSSGSDNTKGLVILNSGMGISNRIWADSSNASRWDSGSSGTGNILLNGDGGTSAGNVSIGSTAANALLAVSSKAAKDLFLVEDNGAGDSTPFVIDSVGNVGMGTNAVDAYLIIDDGAGTSVGNRFKFGPTVSGSNRTLSIYAHSDSTTPGAGWVFDQTFTNSGAAATGKISFAPNGGNVGIGTFFPAGAMFTVNQTSNSALAFRVNDVAGDTSPFIIDSNGNVGIGTITSNNSVLEIPSLKATTGTRYLCIDTNGAISSSASACSGT